MTDWVYTARQTEAACPDRNHRKQCRLRYEQHLAHYGRTYAWEDDLDQTVVDYIASMSDGYFAELATKLFPQIHFPRRTYINEC